jgi:hypothetical protein
MRADITQRGWLNVPAPTNLATISADSILALFPSNGALVTPLNSVRFEWDTRGATSATKWVFNLERTVLGMPVETVLYTIVNGQNFVNVPASEFMSNRDYKWSVVPYSNAYTCAGKSADFTFRTAIVSGSEQLDTDIFKTEIFPNPANDFVNFSNRNNEKINIINAVGQTMESIQLNANSNISISTSSFPVGMYFINVDGIYISKLIVNH